MDPGPGPCLCLWGRVRPTVDAPRDFLTESKSRARSREGALDTRVPRRGSGPGAQALTSSLGGETLPRPSRLREESPRSVSCTGGSLQPSGGAAQGPGWGGPKSSSFSLPPKCGWFPASAFTLSPPGMTLLLRLQAIARSPSGDSQGLWPQPHPPL